MSKYSKGEALPIEEFLYSDLNPVLAPFLHEKLGLTPNNITTIGLILGFIITYLLWIDQYIPACILILFRQVLDSSDGYIARKYNLSTPNGKLYDSISDRISLYLIILVLILKFKHVIMKNKILFVSFVLSWIIISNLSRYRGSCIKKERLCKDKTIRHEILRETRILSYFERKILIVILIIFLYNQK